MQPQPKSTAVARHSALTTLRLILQTTRPQQWTKNLLFVFPPIVFGAKLLHAESLLRVLLACAALILVSGAVYIINDIVDRVSDRAHPGKRSRPIASGDLSPRAALLAAVVLAFAGLTLAGALSDGLALLLILYLALQAAYSLRLKHIPMLDLLAVAAGFVFRVVAGGVVIGVEVSPWLYAFTALLALFLVVGKRRQELAQLGADAARSRPVFQHYSLTLLDETLRIVTTSTLITYLLYTIEVETMTKLGANLGLLTVPIVFYGMLRYLYLLHVKRINGAPDEALMTDRPLQAALLLAGMACFIIIYVL